jgi:Ca2+-binding EF-hand superfamily protein
LIDLFGAGSSKRFDHGRGHGDATSVPGFTERMIRLLFRGLDVDDDSIISNHDVQRCLKLQGSFAPTVETSEIEAFLLASSHDTTTNSNAPKASLSLDKSPGMNFDDLKQVLDSFPMLAFDWDDPLGVASLKSAFRARAQGRAVVSREAAAVIFRRIDTDGDGWIYANDLVVWRRMLPIGRPTNSLIQGLFGGARRFHKRKVHTKEKRARRSKDDDMVAPSLSQRIKNVQRVQAGSTSVQEDLGMKVWDLFMAFRDNPMLGAELAAQCDLLEFILAWKGTKVPHSSTTHLMTQTVGVGHSLDIDSLEEVDSVEVHHTWNDVPDDATVAAFCFVVKLKLCRMSKAQHEIEAREDAVAGELFEALDTELRGFVSARDLQQYVTVDAYFFLTNVMICTSLVGTFIRMLRCVTLPMTICV